MSDDFRGVVLSPGPNFQYHSEVAAFNESKGIVTEPVYEYVAPISDAELRQHTLYFDQIALPSLPGHGMMVGDLAGAAIAGVLISPVVQPTRAAGPVEAQFAWWEDQEERTPGQWV